MSCLPKDSKGHPMLNYQDVIGEKHAWELFTNRTYVHDLELQKQADAK